MKLKFLAKPKKKMLKGKSPEMIETIAKSTVQKAISCFKIDPLCLDVKMNVFSSVDRGYEFLICPKIGQKGFPGVHMFENALKQGWPKLRKIFDDAGFRIAKKLNE